MQNAINNSLLDRVDIPSRPVEDVRLIPTASKEMIDHGYLGDIYRDKPSIGIKRVGEECFLIALLQGFILKDPVLEKAFWEEAYVGGPSAEIGIFLHAYREAQMNGKKVCDANITLLRHALMRVGHDSTWSRGQHDPYEALTVLLRDPGLAARLENMGFYSKERMIRYSWSDTHEEIASFLDKISSWGDVTVSPVGLSPNLTIDQLLFQTMNAEKDEVITNDPITHESVHYHRSLRQFLTAPEYLNVIYKRYDYVSRSRDDGSAYRLSTDVRVEETMTLASKLVGDGKKSGVRARIPRNTFCKNNA